MSACTSAPYSVGRSADYATPAKFTMRAGTKGKPRHPGRVRGGVPAPVNCYLPVEASGAVSGFDEGVKCSM